MSKFEEWWESTDELDQCSPQYIAQRAWEAGHEEGAREEAAAILKLSRSILNA